MRERNIYLADDDPDDVRFFTEALTDVGRLSSLTVSCNGEELIGKLASAGNLPDIIFLDINMPVMNGFECLKQIRSLKHLKDIPVIIFTTSASRVTLEVSYKLGANYFIRKPKDFETLKKILQSVIEIDWSQHTRPADVSGFVYDYQ